MSSESSMLRLVQQKLGDAIRNTVTRGVVHLVAEALKMQGLQISGVEGELFDGIEHPQEYGYTSRAHPGAEGFMVSVGGARSHQVALIVADRRYRIVGLESGEVCIYTDEGDSIHFKRGNSIEVTTQKAVVNAAESVDVKTGVYTLEADLVHWKIGGWSVASRDGGRTSATVSVDIEQDGYIHSTGDHTAGNVSLKGHRHAGVQPGTSTTGPPEGS